MATFDDFEKLDIRVGTIISAKNFEKARKPAYQLEIDFGDGIGVKRSSAQITGHYAADELPGKQVLAVVNFPPRQIANFFITKRSTRDGYCLVTHRHSAPAVGTSLGNNQWLFFCHLQQDLHS